MTIDIPFLENRFAFTFDSCLERPLASFDDPHDGLVAKIVRLAPVALRG